jgi:hypothetical protein
MRVLLFFICLCLFSCDKSVVTQKTDVSVEQNLHNDWAKKRSKIQTLGDYLEIGKNIDTIAKSYFELKYDSIVAINHLEIGMRLSSDTSKVDTIKKSLVLNMLQAETVVKAFDAKETYDLSSMTKCFEPHMTFVFYRKNEIVEYVCVCLRCSNLSSTMKLLDDHKFLSLSPVGKKSFNQICKELNFSECN